VPFGTLRRPASTAVIAARGRTPFVDHDLRVLVVVGEAVA
jgi:hypothetical protein